MTMEASSSTYEFIADNVFKKRVVVSYRQISRSLRIHQSQAKNALYEFYQKNKDKLDASFVISGSNSEGVLIKFSENEQDLEDDVRLFDKISTIQIYSVSLKEINMTIEMLALEESKIRINHDEIELHVKNGMIRGQELKEVHQTTRRLDPPKVLKQEADKIKKETVKPEKSAGLSSGYVSRKKSAITTRPNTVSGYVSRKDKQITPAKRPLTDPNSKYEYKSRKQEKEQPKERVIISSVEQDEPEEVETKPQQTPKTTELENLFADDFSDEDTTMMEADDNNEPIEVIEEENASKSADVQESKENEDVKMEDNEDVEMEDNEENMEPEQEPEQEIETENNPEDQEKLRTKESVTDEGKVTFTSYRKKATPKSETKRLAVRSNTSERKPPVKKSDNKKNDGKKKQSSLMSFFQKN